MCLFDSCYCPELCGCRGYPVRVVVPTKLGNIQVLLELSSCHPAFETQYGLMYPVVAWISLYGQFPLQAYPILAYIRCRHTVLARKSLFNIQNTPIIRINPLKECTGRCHRYVNCTPHSVAYHTLKIRVMPHINPERPGGLEGPLV